MPTRTRNKTQAATNVESVVAELRQRATKATLAGMARYGIPSTNALGVTVGTLKQMAKRIGRKHELAAGLWETGIYEARMLAAFVDDPAEVTAAQMDRWCRQFDSWAIVDTACFALFDRTPHAWAKVAQWSKRREEFIKRAGFALLWSLSVHDKQADDGCFLEGLSFVEREGGDDRHFVKKSINMALRAVGKRNANLQAAAIAVAERLADSNEPAAQWIGKDALRELAGASVARRIQARRKSRGT